MNNDRNLMILGGILGAAVGVAAGFVLFTERGRRLRAELQPEIETVLREAVRLTQVVEDFKAGKPAAQVAGAGAATWPRRTT
jgi:gas vesicle protein